MRQFISGNEAEFNELEARAKRACVCFRSQEMPPCCNPNRADVGFEIDSVSGNTQLLVNKGIIYSGNVSSIREWLQAGVLQFQSFSLLKQWIQGPLHQAFDIQDNTDNELSGRSESKQITDIEEVHKAIREIEKPLYIDEDALFEKLRNRVLGQDDALRAMASVIVRHCARRSPARPAVIFAVGPSGVGKTRTAEELVKVLRGFETENNGYQFLRLDMTEYQESHRVSQLIGAPQGYVGHGEDSQFIDTLRSNPRTIVLFDEIEKAHPAVLRVLMNAMDAGRLSTSYRSSNGHEIDCRRAVFLFTSNLDAKEILHELETRSAFGNRSVEDEVCRRRLHAGGIAPEIVGRIGRFLVYRPLGLKTRAEIIALAIKEVAEEYGLKIEYIKPSVIIEIMRKVQVQDFGVRPERFLIDDTLGDVFARTAEQGIIQGVEIGGPPYECKLHEPLNNATVTCKS